MRSTIFISYDTASDFEFAHRLAKELTANEQSVWIAPDSIDPGESFPSAIERGLDSASVFLLILTPSALGSSWVKAELDAAIDLEKRGQLRIIPLIMKETTLPPLLSSYQSMQIKEDFEGFFQTLLNALGITRKTTLGSSRPDDIEINAPSAAVVPSSPYEQKVLRALRFGENHYNYLIQLSIPQESSILLAIAQRELLRLGVVVFANEDEQKALLLSKLTEELKNNPHGVIGIVGIQLGIRPTIEAYEVLPHKPMPVLKLLSGESLDRGENEEPPRIFHLLWPADGDDRAIAQAVDMFFIWMRGRKHAPRLPTDPYVEAALSAITQAAQLLNIETSKPDVSGGTIVRMLLARENFRIGVAVWIQHRVDVDKILSEMSGEMHANPLNLSALIGIHAGNQTGMHPHQFLNQDRPDGFLFSWKPKSGAESFRWGLEGIFEMMEPSHGEPLDPLTAAFHHGRADAFLEMGYAEDAVIEAEEAIQLNPDRIELYRTRADALLMLDRPKAALSAIKKALAINPNDPPSHTIRAQAFLVMGRENDALTAADRSLKLDPGHAFAHSIRADILLRMRRQKEALASVETAIALDGRDPLFHTIKAEVLLEMKQPQRALKAADLALTLDPDDVEAASIKEKALSFLNQEI